MSTHTRTGNSVVLPLYYNGELMTTLEWILFRETISPVKVRGSTRPLIVENSVHFDTTESLHNAYVNGGLSENGVTFKAMINNKKPSVLGILLFHIFHSYEKMLVILQFLKEDNLQ